MADNYMAHNINEIRDFYHPDKLNDRDYHQDILLNPAKHIIRHLEEIVTIGYGLPNYLKYAQLALHINHFNIKTMVETGTLQGDCCDFFKDVLKRMYTIDIDPWCYEQALIRFKDHPHIVPVLGDSATKLSEVLVNIKEQTLFYLDGHYTEKNNFKGYSNMKSIVGETPIVKELEAIASHPIKNHVIIIDDCGCFANYSHKDYPTIDEMKYLCSRLFPDHSFTAKYGSINYTPKEVNLWEST